MWSELMTIFDSLSSLQIITIREIFEIKNTYLFQEFCLSTEKIKFLA